MLKIKPLADRVIVKPSDAAESKTPGGIIIPTPRRKSPRKAKSWR